MRRIPVSVGFLFAAIILSAATPGNAQEATDQFLVTTPTDPGLDSLELALNGETESNLTMSLLDTVYGWGTHVSMTDRYPCWAEYDACADEFRLPIGNGTGYYTSSGRSGITKASFGTYYCGYGTDAGVVDTGYDLVLYWPMPMALDETTSDGGRIKFTLAVYQNSGAECSGSNTSKGSDTAYCDSGTAEVTWSHAHGDGREDCEGSFTDPLTCHTPDVILLNPAVDTYAWYYYYTRVEVCDSDGTGCSTYTDEGCFGVYWDN